jgi:hypothetical protein
MMKFLDDAKVSWNDKLRLVMLYSIRYALVSKLLRLETNARILQI